MKKLFFYLLISLLSLLAVRSYLNPGFPYTHDGENHLSRFANYRIAVREGQFPPRFAPNLMNHYGYPVFNYNYPLANIASLPFSVLDISYQLTFKIIVFLALVSAGIALEVLLREKIDARFVPVLFGLLIFYASPYLFNLILFRGNIGEVLAWSLLPLVVLTSTNLLDKHRFRDSALSVILWACFWLSHNIFALVGTPIALILILFLSQINPKSILLISKTLTLAFLLTAWFWIPAIVEMNQVVVSSSGNQSDYLLHLPNLNQLLFSNPRFGFSYNGSIDGLAFSIGYTSVLLLLIYLVLLVDPRRRIKVNAVTLSFFLISLLIFFQTQLSKFIWSLSVFNNLRFIQFPWRLSVFISLPLAFLGTWIYGRASRPLRVLLFAVVLLQFVHLTRINPVDYFNKTNLDYDNFAQSTSTQNENTAKSFRYQDIGDWKPSPSILDGNGVIIVERWTGSGRIYQLDIDSTAVIVEPTMNFLGWSSWLIDESGRKTKKLAYIDDDRILGRIAYQIDSGSYRVESKFTQNTVARMVGNGLFILGIILLIANLIQYHQKSNHAKATRQNFRA